MKNKIDLRIVKSRKVIKEAFLQLLKEKCYSNITVTDIAKKAMINRKTFYIHYETKENLYNEITDEIIKEITPPILSKDIFSLNGNEQKSAVTYLLIKIKENREIFEIFINDSTNLNFTEKLKTTLINKPFSRADLTNKNTLFTSELLSDVYFTTLSVIIRWWISTENISTDYVIDMILEIFSKKSLELLGIDFDK